MTEIKGFLRFLYRHHFVRYLFVGGTTFSIDFGVLVFSHEILNINLLVATSIAYWTSIAYNFSLNRWWTFEKSENNKLSQNALLYGCLLAFNYAFVVVAVGVLSTFIYYGACKIVATIITTFWTYFIYKKYIFV